MIHTEITTSEVADRVAIRELVDAYAHCADRRDADGQKSLFTDDTHFVVYLDGHGSVPTQVLDGREALTPVVDDRRIGRPRPADARSRVGQATRRTGHVQQPGLGDVRRAAGRAR
jgi:SnoaL-like domain